MADKSQQTGTGSLFYIFLLLPTFAGLIYFFIWGFLSQSLQGIALAATFTAMILASLALAAYAAWRSNDFSYFGAGSFSKQCLWFVLSFIFASLMVKLSPASTQSVVTLPENAFFSTLSGVLPPVIDWVMNQVVIPIAEESFWTIGIPATMYLLLDALGKRFKVFKNPYLQISIIFVVLALSFAWFHIAKVTFIGFVIAAIFFRSIIAVTVLGDLKLDIIKYADVSLGFAFGYHTGNNIAKYGFGNSFAVLSTEPLIGMLVGAVFFIILLGALDAVGNKIRSKQGVLS